MPGQEKIVSVMTPPSRAKARLKTKLVTTGSMALRAACLSRMDFSVSPLARAAMM